MQKRIQKLITSLAVFVASFGVFIPAVPALAFDVAQGSGAAVCEGVEGTAGSTCTTGKDLNDVLHLVVNILSFIAGFAAIIMIIVSGLKYITANGDASKVASAKNGLIYAVIGLVIAALAQFIVRFVLAKTGADNVRP